MSILTISDGKLNGKGGNMYVTFDYHCYIYECKILDNNFFINNKIVALAHISKVIFNFNEDKFTYKWDRKLITTFKNVNDMIELFKDISTLIKNKYPNIIIYQDPSKCFDLGDKVLVFDKIKNIKDDMFCIPKYKKISNSKNLENVDFFPLIILPSSNSIAKDSLPVISSFSRAFTATFLSSALRSRLLIRVWIFSTLV